ncbi:MAG: hypothetical protein H6823_15635 [Planctomycetaceae bacterium]|nr:hypothetical protein [Planctomycetales bacterium]MCB9939671.1 hypothetical protein [Planctomycetaceae bacterium]
MHEQCNIRRMIGLIALLVLPLAPDAVADIGDPQVATDHEWYPGELAYSTFERLAETQATLYEKVVGARPTTDEQRVLAAWLWRNTHYWHGEQGVEDLWGKGFQNDTDTATREYWTGLFAHGFGLCGTTHAQWTAEMEHLLGHNRARVVGVTGHNSFEVFLTGGPYGAGRWALLDHDVSTVIFDEQGRRLLSIAEIKENLRRWTKENASAEKQHGWLVSGLHPDDGSAFNTYRSAEYLAGYAGPPPIVHLRRGESLRRYVSPGLDDGHTFVFWGRNYNSESIPGPERSRTWVNQPARMYGSKDGTGYHAGQARYANAVYKYQPDFNTNDYREGIIDESERHVTFEFNSPYIIAATPPNDDAWGIYQPRCRNGLVVTGDARVPISLSTDRGRTWQDAGVLKDRLDLTDLAKGHRQYWLKFESSASKLAGTNLLLTTVCQANSSIIPRLTDNGSRVEFQASGRAIVSAGPNIAQAETHRIAGAFDSPRVTLELAAPRNLAAVAVYAAAHVASSNPPSPDIAYNCDFSTDEGKSWQPLVSDWRITRQGDEPADFWSQSFCWGSTELSDVRQPIQVRFQNNGGKRYRRAEIHVLYRVPEQDATRVTFHWQDDTGVHTASHDFPPTSSGSTSTEWRLPTGKDVKTLWVEYRPTWH